MPAAMTHRERVRAALNHQEPDRVPVDLGQAAGDGITAIAYQNLLRHLRLGERPVNVWNREIREAAPDEDVLSRFGVDFRAIRPARPITVATARSPRTVFKTSGAWCAPARPAATTSISPSARSPRTPAWPPSNAIPGPTPKTPAATAACARRRGVCTSETDYALVLDADCTFFDGCGMLRGWENFYSDLLINRQFAEALMDRYLEIKLTMARHLLEEVGEFADVVVCSRDDLGSTQAPIISPNLFRQWSCRVCAQSSPRPGATPRPSLFHHCDGAIVPFLADLSDAGVQITNPVQVNAQGMGDTARLKRQFGDRLSLLGRDRHQRSAAPGQRRGRAPGSAAAHP